MIVDIKSMRDTVGSQYRKPDIGDLEIYAQGLDIIEKSKDFLKIQRNLSDETIYNFKLGFDVINQRISIPETKNGEVVNIAFRFIDNNEKVKYLKEKGCENWIFNEQGIEEAKKKGGILITSNQFDAMSAWQMGVKNVVSVPVGKDGYGVWIELFDNIPKVYICFENTKISKKYSLDLAERIGSDKCYEVILPSDINDINSYFKSNDSEQFRDLIRNAKPYYSYKFKGLSDVIDLIRDKKDNVYKFKCIPYVEFEEDWIAVISGVSNSGKTTHVLNIANELADNKIPVLILPFERGIKTVGKRFLQVRTDKMQYQLEEMNNTELDDLVKDVCDLPIYFSVPMREQIRDTIARAKKIFGTKVVIVDHLDYLVRKSTENHNVETSNTLQEFKSLAQEFNILFLIVHHIKKQEGTGSVPKKPKMEDLKGSSSTYQDPEAVIMLSSPEKGQLEVDIVKNKGEMGSRIYNFNTQTGKIGLPIEYTPETQTEKQQTQSAFDKF